ncbi:hypothetical protein C1I95_07840 [Micromonospora craterilacus]|uniref:Uncharacterized protein n=1 Tax=Micromonospora craterilacus TaxID=1655439 RepID=A0A2W2EYC7_9ACTN|nr:hypothetical protein [Micromonospora craterilacus]PZG21265.1 hypothetical protein C1I95_07840 [Micromonospora craterilacus]
MTAALRRLVGTPFGRAVLACLALAGWALWSGGILDGPIARQVRSSSVYVAPEVDLDRAAAERVIGNRRLVVLLMAPGADLSDACGQTEQAAQGTVVLAMSPAGADWDTYGCSQLRRRDDRDLGRAMVVETTISRGVDAFVDRPLEALKVVTINYDRLVKAGAIPDGARTISPSLPRYLLAGAAIGGVVAGAAVLWIAGRRAGRLAAARQARRESHADGRSALSAAAATLAQQIVDLDQRYGRVGNGRASRAYLRLATDYTRLLDDVTTVEGADEAAVRRLRKQVKALSRQASRLAGEPPGRGTPRRRARVR